MILKDFFDGYVDSDQQVYISTLPGHVPVTVGDVCGAESGHLFKSVSDAALYFGDDEVRNVSAFDEGVLRIIVKNA